MFKEKMISFGEFLRLETSLKNLTLIELSELIYGESNKISFLCKLRGNQPISINMTEGGNFKKVYDFVKSYGYTLVSNHDFNKSESIKDRILKELREELRHQKLLNEQLTKKLEACEVILQAVDKINKADETMRFCLRPKHNKRKEVK